MRILALAVLLAVPGSIALAQQPASTSATAPASPAASAPAATAPAANSQTASSPATSSQTASSQTASPPAAGTPAAGAQKASVPAASTPAVSTQKASAQTASTQKASAATGSVQTASTEPAKAKAKAASAAAATTQAIPIATPGEDLDPHIQKGSEEDVNAVGERKIGARGLGNWYSTNWEIGMGHQYAMEIEKSSHLVTDPVVTEYINRIGQNLVKNSDAKVPFTFKVLDTDEINAMALPGGYVFVNSGLILACDNEDELAGVMAHEISHVAAHHAAREMTRMNYMQIGSIPLMIFTQGTWTGYGIYEASQLAIPLTFLQFSRQFEGEADYLGIQYMYRAGYDPQGMVSIFEKLDALQKHKPGAISRAFSDHPATPDRIAAIENEIATILPARRDYLVTTSEFDQVKARLARIQNKRGVINRKNLNKPTLRRVGGSNNDPSLPNDSGSDQPTLGRRD